MTKTKTRKPAPPLSVMEWGELPPRRAGRAGGRLDYTDLYDDLAQRKGEWAKVMEVAAERRSLVSSRQSVMKKRGFEATTRVSDDGTTVALWARVTQ